jgi:hypothetical protein
VTPLTTTTARTTSPGVSPELSLPAGVELIRAGGLVVVAVGDGDAETGREECRLFPGIPPTAPTGVGVGVGVTIGGGVGVGATAVAVGAGAGGGEEGLDEKCEL